MALTESQPKPEKLTVQSTTSPTPPSVPLHSQDLREETCRSLNVTKCVRRQDWWDDTSQCVEWAEVPWQFHVDQTWSQGLAGILFGAWVGCDWFYGDQTNLRTAAQNLAPKLTTVVTDTQSDFLQEGEYEMGTAVGILGAVAHLGTYTELVDNKCIVNGEDAINVDQLQDIDPRNETGQRALTAQEACWYLLLCAG